LQHELGEGEVVYGWVEAPFQESAMLRNINHLMTDVYDDPVLVHELMRFCLEMELEFGLAQIEAGARYIGVGDAIATLISPKHFEKFNFPYVAELIARLKKAGARVKYHACGNTKALLPLLADLGADILNLDSLVNLAEVKEKLGDKVCIKGNLDPVRVLLNGTPESITESVRQCIEIGGQGGSFILSPGCEVPRDTPLENLEAFVQAAKTYGRYPLAGEV
jgi:uroporphyrinogen decarboxylase